jgi:outer membrane protein OmpA-like peptidoglycan-associated protein
LIALTFALALAAAPAALAQGGMSSGGNTRTVASGQKMKLKGVVTSRQPDSFVVQDANGVSTTVTLTNATSVKTSGGFLRGGTNYGVTAILRGLNLEVEGRGDGTSLVAEKIRFKEGDLRTARTVEANVTPVENRVGAAEGRIGQVEQNAQRLSGQLDELAAVSNAARGGAKAAHETADRALAGVNQINDRISALDDYQVQDDTSILFRVGSAVLSADSKSKLDQIAQQALQAKGYVLEVSGFASADGSTEANRRLSQRRADTVIRYLVESHNIPLRRIVTPYGYGEAQPVADNTSREGREQNRRVEVKVLVNRGLIEPLYRRVKLEITSTSPGARVFLVPRAVWDSDTSIINNDEKLNLYRPKEGDTTPVSTDVYEQVWILIYELNGKRSWKKVDVIGPDKNSVKID